MGEGTAAGRAIHLFVGPSLGRHEREPLEGIVVHGPVAQGDVYALVARRPLVIALIDGYFERVPSVWHKEILWALSQGIHVLGAASMGALRAAELSNFGMRGVGRIFEAYRSGELEDDDEVAVAHGPEESGFLAISEAMVNLRATLGEAAAQGVISRETAGRLTAFLKRHYYADRHYGLLFEASPRPSVSPLAGNAQDAFREGESARLQQWLAVSAHRVDAKREDALALIDELHRLMHSPPAPLRVAWTFQRTDAWEQVRRGMSLRGAEPVAPERMADLVLDELRLEPREYFDVQARTRLRVVQSRWARSEGFLPSPEQVERTMGGFLRDRGLTTESEIRDWLQQQSLEATELERLLEDQARADWTERLTTVSLDADMLDTLKLEGRFETWAARARAKEQAHSRRPPARAELPSDSEILAWFFDRLGRPLPDDLPGYARSLGLRDVEQLVALLAEQHWYESAP